MGVNNSNQKTRQVQRRWRQAMLLFPIMLLVMSAVGVIFSTAPAYAAPVVNVTTFAGTPATVGYADGLAASAQFSWPHDIAFDNAGTMYIADTTNNRIRTVSPSGVVSTFAGSGVAGGADGTGTAAHRGDGRDDLRGDLARLSLRERRLRLPFADRGADHSR